MDTAISALCDEIRPRAKAEKQSTDPFITDVDVRNIAAYPGLMEIFAGLPAFVAAAETGSFIEAGRQLGISASAIGKSIARLELRLGIRLFHRTTRTMRLTSDGALFLQRCQRLLAEAEAAEHELHSLRSAPKGRLRISLPAVGTLFLPVISAFLDRFPEVELDIDFSDRKVDLVEEGFDAAIRIGDSDDSRLISRTLGVFRRDLVAAPAYLERVGRPLTTDDLASHVCLLYRFPGSGKIEPWPVPGWDALLKDAAFEKFSCNSIEALLHLASAGKGIACLPGFATRRMIDSQALETIMTDEPRAPRSLVMLWPSSKFLSPKLRAFIDLFATSFEVAS